MKKIIRLQISMICTKIRKETFESNENIYLFSGHLRTFKDCIPFYKKFQRDHEVRFLCILGKIFPLLNQVGINLIKNKKINKNDFSFLNNKLSSLELLCEDQSEIIKKNLIWRI